MFSLTMYHCWPVKCAHFAAGGGAEFVDRRQRLDLKLQLPPDYAMHHLRYTAANLGNVAALPTQWRVAETAGRDHAPAE